MTAVWLFEPKNSSSLGLTIVETLVKKQLHGEFFMKSDNGSCTTVIWSEHEQTKHINS